MRGRAGIHSPRQVPAPSKDLAERTPLIVGQRVRRRPRRRLLFRFALAGGLLALVLTGQAAFLHWLLTSPRFAVTGVDVQGESRLHEEEVRATAGIGAGANLFRLDPGAVVERLLRHPRVKRAAVIRTFPDRVTLLIEEREPFALAVHAGRLFWLDEDGHVLGPEPRAVAPGLPVITGLLPDGAEVGLMSSPARTHEALALLRHLLRSRRALAAQLSEIDMGRAEGPVLYTVDGLEVYLGSVEWGQRLERLSGVLVRVREAGEPVASLDLRFRDQVVLKPKSS
ncbi:MAG: cell division protein FtsQ/DivIB [Candidatus Methylomirabilia bacterium]